MIRISFVGTRRWFALFTGLTPWESRIRNYYRFIAPKQANKSTVQTFSLNNVVNQIFTDHPLHTGPSAKCCEGARWWIRHGSCVFTKQLRKQSTINEQLSHKKKELRIETLFIQSNAEKLYIRITSKRCFANNYKHKDWAVWKDPASVFSPVEYVPQWTSALLLFISMVTGKSGGVITLILIKVDRTIVPAEANCVSGTSNALH